MDELRSVRVVVSGRVQGVFFRASTLEQAQALGVVGTVRNLPDEDVEVIAQGPAARIEELIRWLHRGPPAARVRSVRIEERPPDPSLTGFRIER